MVWGRVGFYSFVTIVMACIGCSRFFHGGGGSSVTVARVRATLTAPQVTVVGQLVGSDRGEIQFPREVKIDKIFVNEGERVTAGQPLLTLSQTEVTVQLNQSRAARREAEAILEKNQFLLKNREKMLEEGKIDQTQYAAMESEIRTSEATLERLKSDIVALETQIGATSVPSPITGVVQQKLATNGSSIAANQPILGIVQTDPIFVWFQLTADESLGIARETPLAVRIEELPGEKFTATVHHVGPELHPQGGTFDVWAAIPNPHEGLKIGMRAYAEFTTTKQHQVFIVPASAILMREGVSYLFTVQNGVARSHKVTVKGRTESDVTLADGVGPDDLVVVRGQQSLQEGAMVDVWR